MSDKISLTAELREDVGKGASRRLRRSGEKVPAIMYGAEADSQLLTLTVKELNKVMEQETFYSQVLDVIVAGKPTQAVVRDLQRNPANGRVQHLDFLRVSANKELQVNIPLHFINEEECVGVKFDGSIIAHNLTEVEINALPANLPEYIEVDMAEVETGQSIHLSELKLPEGVEIVALMNDGEDRDIPVVSVTARRAETEEETEDSVESAEVPTIADEGDDDAKKDEADDG